MELWKRKNSYAEFTKYPKLLIVALGTASPGGSKPLWQFPKKKFPWLKQITSLPLSLHGRQVSELLLQTMKADACPALLYAPPAKADNPQQHLMPRAGALNRALMLLSQALGWILCNVPGSCQGPGGGGANICSQSHYDETTCCVSPRGDGHQLEHRTIHRNVLPAFPTKIQQWFSQDHRILGVGRELEGHLV